MRGSSIVENLEGPPPMGRERATEQAIQAAVASGGDGANMAIQLAILQQLEKLAAPAKEKSQPLTIEDILYGASPTIDTENGAASGSSGVSSKGAQALLRLQRSQEQNPLVWAGMADERASIELGSNLTGLPWSMQAYGQQRITFAARHEHLHRMWVLLCHYHTLSRLGRHQELDLAITQGLKSVEQAVQANGAWKIAWTLTGLPDPIDRNGSGLTHPQELSAAI
eukprot:6472843-Amphidinium_carterae.1